MKILSILLIISLSQVCFSATPIVKHDKHDRITEVKYSDTEKINYTYDPSGNILTVVVNTDGGSLEKIDSDGDGMLDLWEITYFGGINSSDPNGDNDGDGVPNLIEFATKTDPTDNKKGLNPVTIIAADTDAQGQYLLVQYRKNNDAKKLNIGLEISHTLKAAQWTQDQTHIVQQGAAVSNTDGTETITCKCYTPANEKGKLFVRLKVVK